MNLKKILATFIGTLLLGCSWSGPVVASDAAPIASRDAIESLQKYLATASENRDAISKQPFAHAALTRTDAERARQFIARDAQAHIRVARAAEMKSRVIELGDKRMPFAYQVFGEKPASGRSLYISMHGGGGAPKAVNDRQWENQKRLYRPLEGVYVAPRAPTDTWNLWHQAHIDALFVRLIENMVAFEDVNWDRVYLMGYSAGGDGVYQLAPRSADRWAAAAMMAGHPNEASPLGLRNVPFALQVGGKDAAYDRNNIAASWKTKLAELQQSDPDGYEHFVKIYPNKGHWMDREDAVAVPWMAKHTRNATPAKIVWLQDDVTHTRYYYLGINQRDAKAGTKVIAEVDGQTIELTTEGLASMLVFLDDRFMDLDQDITIRSGGKVLFQGRAQRTIANLFQTQQERRDPVLSFPARVEVQF